MSIKRRLPSGSARERKIGNSELKLENIGNNKYDYLLDQTFTLTTVCGIVTNDCTQMLKPFKLKLVQKNVTYWFAKGLR